MLTRLPTRILPLITPLLCLGCGRAQEPNDFDWRKVQQLMREEIAGGKYMSEKDRVYLEKAKQAKPALQIDMNKVRELMGRQSHGARLTKSESVYLEEALQPIWTLEFDAERSRLKKEPIGFTGTGIFLVVMFIALVLVSYVSVISVGRKTREAVARDRGRVVSSVLVGLAGFGCLITVVSGIVGLVLIVLVFKLSYPWWPVWVAFTVAGVFLVATAWFGERLSSACEKCGGHTEFVMGSSKRFSDDRSVSVLGEHWWRKCNRCGHTQQFGSR